jgi:hypothetical protein
MAKWCEAATISSKPMPCKAMALVLEWAAEHREELMEDWKLCSQMQPPKPIAPLP